MNRQRCSRHRWAYPLYLPAPTPAMRIEATALRQQRHYRCTRCGLPGYRIGGKIEAYPNRLVAAVRRQVERWNARVLAVREGTVAP